MLKQKLIDIFTTSSLILMLAQNHITKEYSRMGMDIWINNVLPSLFPYILIINIIMYLDAFNTLNNILYPIIGRVFSVSKNACFCIICGFLCGYPIGIKTINDMLEKKLICKEEANYLSVFCNNISPAFYINFIFI